MRRAVAFLFFLILGVSLAQDEIHFDAPLDLHLSSEDNPIVVSFEYADDITSPRIKVSMENADMKDLEAMVRQDDGTGNFVFNSQRSSSSRQQSSSPASRIVANASMICVGLLSLAFFQQSRKASIVLLVGIVMCICYVQAQSATPYKVVIQIPRVSANNLQTITLQSPSGGWFTISVSVRLPQLSGLNIDLGGRGGVSIENLLLSESLSIHAEDVSVSGNFGPQLQALLRASRAASVKMSNMYTGRIYIQAEQQVLEGTEYCRNTVSSLVCGQSSGTVKVIAPEARVYINSIRPSAGATRGPVTLRSSTATKSTAVSPPEIPRSLSSTVSKSTAISSSMNRRSPSSTASNSPSLPKASAIPSASNSKNGSSVSASPSTTLPVSPSAIASSLRTKSASKSLVASSTPKESSSAIASSSTTASKSPSGTSDASMSVTGSQSPSATSRASASATPSASTSTIINQFDISNPGEFLLMRRMDITRDTNGEHPVVGRSYNGYPWEAVPDADYAPITYQCSTTQCIVLDSGTYEVEIVNVPDSLVAPESDAMWSRLMMQATLGVNKETLDSVVSQYADNYDQWVQDQMDLPATYHRTHFRQRVNSRRSTKSKIADLFKPCELGSRYHRNAFNPLDEGKLLTIEKVSGSVLTLSIGGYVRTEVDNFAGYFASNNSALFPKVVSICSVSDRIDGTIKLDENESNECVMRGTNPAIEFRNLNSGNTRTLQNGQANFVSVLGKPDAIVLKQIQAAITCTGLSSINSYVRFNNSYYRFDPRLKLLQNTLQNPVELLDGHALDTCPAVRKTFLNEATCQQRPSCAKLSFNEAPVLMNRDTMKAWYEADRLYVYEIRDLRLEDPYDESPCRGTSRWLRKAGACTSPTTFGSDSTRDVIVNELTDSADRNLFVRDIRIENTNCDRDDLTTVGANVTIDGECFEHVNRYLHNIYDFSFWTVYHDGNEPAAKAGRPNPIAKWAEEDKFYLKFPSWHPMSRFAEKLNRKSFTYVGRLGDSIPFDSLASDLQTEAMATRVRAIADRSNDGFEACGSPAEVENIPELGDRYRVREALSISQLRGDRDDYRSDSLKTNVWFEIARTSRDLLRQRASWALSQIFPMSEVAGIANDAGEAWFSYYDIFVRNVFGNFRDVLREVSFSVPMSQYLSFYQNKGLLAGAFPDENYAREVMQLFSIGLWKLNDDGTRMLDDQGKPMATYTNDDIVDFARLWTGFDSDNYRSNIEPFAYTDNGVDPSVIRPYNRDPLPKAKLDSGYIGDQYPLCYDLPDQHWLKKGATYKFTGASSDEERFMDQELPDGAGLIGRFAPAPTSELYEALCQADRSNACTFPTEVKLDRTIACSGTIECGLQSMTTVKIFDDAGNVTRYYTYHSAPCVKLSLFDNGRPNAFLADSRQCSPSTEALGSPLCCNPRDTQKMIKNITSEICLVSKELVDFETNAARCAALGYVVCGRTNDRGDWSDSCAPRDPNWVNDTCSLMVQVYQTGQIGIYDAVARTLGGNSAKTLLLSSGNVFRTRWENDEYPTVDEDCAPGCTVVLDSIGDSCLCNFTLATTAVFVDRGSVNLPSQAEVLARLTQGALEPSLYGRSHALCGNACGTPVGYRIWVSSPQTLDADTIFEVESPLAGGSVKFLFNRESMVSIGSYMFRNPPRFMPYTGDQVLETTEALSAPPAVDEVEAMLTHLFEHHTTAPFIVYRLIQRLVTSNPSPRYMTEAVTAFRTGTYKNLPFSGKYGDLGATMAAILLDREARTPMLEMDRTFGVIREPILKLTHMLKALKFDPTNGLELDYRKLSDVLAQQPHYQPSVFGFFLPENRPAGPLNDLALVSPEAEIMITPNLINTMNSFIGLIDNGFNSQSFARTGRDPDAIALYLPPANSTAEAVIDELDLLLTGRRLNPSYKQYIINDYNKTLTAKNPTAALKRAQELVYLSAEFQVSNAIQVEAKEVRPEIPPVEDSGRPYKAIVVLVMQGGADTYNLVVPHSNCKNGKDYYAEYESVRKAASIRKSELLTIAVPSGTQPCNTFGVHPAMPALKNLYADNDAIFFANTGALVDPITKAEYSAKPRTKRLPPSLFSHNVMTVNSQSLHPQNAAAAGVLGRAVQSQRTRDFRSMMYSIAGKMKIIEGTEPSFVGSRGVRKFDKYNEFKDDIKNMTALVSDSPMVENYFSTLVNSLEQTEKLGDLLNGVTLTQTYPNDLTSLAQVSRLIKLRKELGAERDVFVVSKGGFDTHGTFDLGEGRLGVVDEGLFAFSEEMKANGTWNNVAFLVISEFGRTLSPNAAGTDHAWGGNYFLAGGSVNGGKMLGRYPEQLTDGDDYQMGRGRLIPSTGWEAVWNGLLGWFDVAQEDMATVLPNLVNFPASDIFTRRDLFGSA